jgi:exopolysaccharide biosynthesis polyprenyl glycosylphosphotransferase
VFPYLDTPLARRSLERLALQVAPAAAAGLIAFDRSSSAAYGLLFLGAMLLASRLLSGGGYPLHLMRVASLLLRMAVPLCAAAFVQLAVLAGGGNFEAGNLVAPVLGAWLITAVAVRLQSRFDSSRELRMAAIGSAELARGLASELKAAGVRGYRVVGYVSADDGSPPESGVRRLGALADLGELVQRERIDLLVNASGLGNGGALAYSRISVLEEAAASCLNLPVRMIDAGQLYEQLLGHVPLGTTNAAWFQYVMHPRFRAGSPFWKRWMDLAGGALMLAFAAPLLAVAALAVKLADGGPVLYRQPRIGEGGQTFKILKLRTMSVDADAVGTAQWSPKHDPRVTKVGGFLRRTHVDELPQLVNVMRGDMTLVGPRPEQPPLVSVLEQEFVYYDRRHLIKPGITGWAQVSCGYAGSEIGTAWKLCHDLFYLKHRSMLADVMIMLETIPLMVHTSQYEARPPQEQFLRRPVSEQPEPSRSASVV